MLRVVNDPLQHKGLLLKTGTAVDATLISAPSSTKNSSGECDPEMKQSKKGNQWYFGMKAHIGVDAESGLVRTVRGTSGNVNDVVVANGLLHGEESISVRIAAIEFWRKPWQCVPNGHHAGVVFDGEGVARLVKYLAAHATPWHVSVDTDAPASGS